MTIPYLDSFVSTIGDKVLATKTEIDLISSAATSPSKLDYKHRAQDKLDKNTYDVTSLQYPKDLMGSNNEYGNNYIVFYINIQQDSVVGVNIDGLTNATIDDPNTVALTKGAQSDSKVATGTNATLMAGAAGTAFKGLFTTSPSKAVGAIIGGVATEAMLLNSARQTRATKRLKATITLHNPNTISTSYQSSWEGEDTAKTQMAALRFGAVDNIANAALAPMISGITEALKTEGLGSYLQMQTGQAANSKKEMLFKGIEFREFDFTYRFAPRSWQELMMVQDIIKMFKFHMHPEYVQGTGNFLYLYPSEFDILYYNNGTENSNLPRYTSCILTSMNVDYTPNGNFTAFGGSLEGSSVATNGAPTEIAISLHFKELAHLSKKEIADGY